MGRQEVWKECKFCGIRFGQDTGRCPKCGSSNAKLVMPKEMEANQAFFAEENEKRKKEQAEKQTKKKKTIKKWKKALCTIGIILAIILLLYIVGSFLLVKWALWMSQKETEKWLEDTESTESIVTNVSINETQEPIREEALSDEEWLKYVLPILDKWYAKNADEEILKIHKKALDENRPMYMWDHYMYGAALYDFSIIEDIWEREQSGEILQDYENADLLNYYFLFWDFEETYVYTDQEKEWLKKYVRKLREDVEWRLGRTDSELQALYEDMTAGQGYVDYTKVVEYVKNSEIWVASAIKATESMDDEAWMDKMFPVLDELYEAGNDWELMLIYYNTENQHKNGRPFELWAHGHYVAYVWDMMSMEQLLQKVDDGKRLSELDYGTILNTYLRYEDYADANIMTEEEMERFTPYFASLEQCATSLWDFTQGEWKALLEKSKKEYVGVEVESLIHKWLMELDQAKRTEEPEISE